MKTVLFDLDGTLTDSREGIVNSIKYALNAFDYEIPNEDTLQLFLGPPIVESFQEHCGMTEEEARIAYKKFQERYGTLGKFENRVYDGISELLTKLRAEHYYVAVATAKPEHFAREILDHFYLTPYFNLIVGADTASGLIHKEDILKKALNLSRQPLQDKNGRRIAYMVGDRKYDVESANALGCISIGVTYGYGAESELLAANAEYLCDEPDEIAMTLDLEEMMVRR